MSGSSRTTGASRTAAPVPPEPLRIYVEVAHDFLPRLPPQNSSYFLQNNLRNRVLSRVGNRNMRRRRTRLFVEFARAAVE